MDLVGRLYSLEKRVEALVRQLGGVASRLKRAETAIQQTGGGPGGGGDSRGRHYWCVGDGTAHVATGTWPSLTAASFTADVYENVGGTQTLVSSGATVYWWYKDAMSTTSGKLIPCLKNADGSYDALEESCTVVT